MNAISRNNGEPRLRYQYTKSVVLYLLGVTSLGLWYSRGIKSSKDYFLAGRSLPWWAF